MSVGRASVFAEWLNAFAFTSVVYAFVNSAFTYPPYVGQTLSIGSSTEASGSGTKGSVTWTTGFALATYVIEIGAGSKSWFRTAASPGYDEIQATSSGYGYGSEGRDAMDSGGSIG